MISTLPPAHDVVDESSPAAPPAAPPRATLGFMLSHPAHVIALGFGSGLSRLAPGTSGTLWAWAIYAVWARLVPATRLDAWTGWVILVSLPVGWWACTVTARHMRVADPGQIVWDEVVAFWLVLWLVGPAGLFVQCIAFALFRFFDAAKPGPVRWADGLFKGFGARGGFGILFDDLVAAGCTLLVMAVGARWL